MINVASGGLTVTGNHTVTLTGAVQGSAAGTIYQLFTYTGAAPPSGDFTVNTGALGGSYTYTPVFTTPGEIDLKVTSTAPQLSWTGSGGNGNWNNGTPNWSGASTTFTNGDAVTFANGGANTNITVAAAVNPQSITFTNTAATSYTIASSGANLIGGSAYVIQSGSGTNTLNGTNSYTGGTVLGAGTLNIGSDLSLGAVPAGPAANVWFTGNSTLQFGSSLALATNRTVSVSAGRHRDIRHTGQLGQLRGERGRRGKREEGRRRHVDRLRAELLHGRNLGHQWHPVGPKHEVTRIGSGHAGRRHFGPERLGPHHRRPVGQVL